ncbi:hypothetical protein ACLOJK_025767 [Asimina triloba]
MKNRRQQRHPPRSARNPSTISIRSLASLLVVSCINTYDETRRSDNADNAHLLVRHQRRPDPPAPSDSVITFKQQICPIYVIPALVVNRVEIPSSPASVAGSLSPIGVAPRRQSFAVHQRDQPLAGDPEPIRSTMTRPVRYLACNVRCLSTVRRSAAVTCRQPPPPSVAVRCRPQSSSGGAFLLREEGGAPYYGAPAANQTRYTLSIIRAHLLSLYIGGTPFRRCAYFGQGVRLFTSVYISLAHMYGGDDL